VVGDGDAVGIGAEIAQQVFWTTEGRLGIDDPVLAEQQSEPGCEGSWFGEWSEGTVELDLGFAESILESGDELTAEHTAEHFDGKKKGEVGGDPASVVRSEAASGDYAVNMRMKTPTPTVP